MPARRRRRTPAARPTVAPGYGNHHRSMTHCCCSSDDEASPISGPDEFDRDRRWSSANNTFRLFSFVDGLTGRHVARPHGKVQVDARLARRYRSRDARRDAQLCAAARRQTRLCVAFNYYGISGYYGMYLGRDSMRLWEKSLIPLDVRLITSSPIRINFVPILKRTAVSGSTESARFRANADMRRTPLPLPYLACRAARCC